MRIDTQDFQIQRADEHTKTQKVTSLQDPFDLDLKVNDLKFSSPVPINELITSKSLCTPTCGNTGTKNSFCC